MTKYNKSQLYFFKLPSSFFKRDEMEWLKTQIDGYKVITIYQELIFETINKNGILARIIGNETKAYSVDSIARLINEQSEDVEYALKILIKLGLIEIKEYDEDDPIYYIEESMDLTNQSVSARKKELQRKGKICPPDIEIEEDIENRDKNLDIITNTTEIKKEKENDFFSIFLDYAEDQFNKHLSIKERSELKELVNNYSQKELKICIDEAVYRNKKTIGYVAGILENREQVGDKFYA